MKACTCELAISGLSIPLVWLPILCGAHSLDLLKASCIHAAEKAERQKKRARKEAKSKLSFFNDEDEQQEQAGNEAVEEVGVLAASQYVSISR